MKRLALAAVLLAGTAFTAPASAVTVDPSELGQSTGAIPFNGIVNGTLQPGLTGTLNLTFQAINFGTNTWTFGYSVDNTSTAPITGSAISAFGFDTSPELTALTTISGFYTNAVLGGTAPGGLGHVDFCGSSGPTCAGGASNGLDINAGFATGTFSLDFDGSATPLSVITLDNFFLRYQEIAGSALGTSGIGLPSNGPIQFCTTPPCDTVAVPGPIVGAGIPGLIAACGGMFGFNFWRRRRTGNSLPA